MYPISNALKQAFESNAKQYARITVGSTVIDNSRIRLGSFSVNRYALAEDTVVFGSCVAAEFNVALENGDGAYSTGTFLGQEAYVEVGCDLSGTVTYVPLGYFKFDMVTAQASALKLSALDRMMNFEQNVTTPYAISGTVSALIDTICTACGVTRGTFTLPVNGTVALSGEVSDVKTYRDILRWIGEVTGTIAYIGYDGKLYFGWYSGTEDFSVDPTNRTQGSISDDATTITSVSIVQGENMVTAGTGAKIVIRDNALIPLASSSAQTIADALYNHVNGFTYRTFEAGVFPMPHIAPLDCGVYSDLDGNDYNVCCTDWTFTLNANTKIAGKGGKQAYGRGYTLDESVFTARNIAAGAVTAEKISVQDLAALRATIAGWKISTDALYKDITINGTTYRVSMNAPASPSLTTPAFSVKKRTSSSNPWEEVADILYSGKVISKDFEATGAVKIAPDYDMQAAGVYAIDLEQNGAELYANPNFLNIEEGGSQTHLDSAVISSTAADDTMLRMENYGADYAEFRATQGDYGTRNYKEAALSPKEVRVKSNSYSGNPAWEAKMTSEKVSVSSADGTLHTDMEYNGVTADSDDYSASVRAGSAGGFLEVIDRNTGKSSMLSLSDLTVNDHDLLRLTPHFAQMFATSIPANADLNTTTYLAVGQYSCFTSAAAASLSNCPTDIAFCMTVLTPFSSVYDNEASALQYRVRKIVCYNGTEYVQAANSNGSYSWTYNAWRKVVDVGTNEYKRIVPHLYAGYATVVPSGANLNSQAYMKIGEYFLTTAVAQSCSSYLPYVTEGRMTVYAPTGTTYDDESGTWKYRVREYETWGGKKWRQFCQTSVTAGSWTFGSWIPVTAVDKDSYSNTTVKDGSLVARRQGNVVSITSSDGAKSVAARTWTLYVTLAAKYAPSERMYVSLGNNANANQFVRIDTDGKVYLYSTTAISSATNFGFSATYIVD